MKALTTNGLTKLIQLIKSTFIPNTDVETTTEMDVVTATAVNIDNTPTQSSTNLVTSGGVASALSGKQDTLVSGTNIKTVNGNSLLGSGDISITQAVAWGNITGTLSNQTDLKNALDLKADSATTLAGYGITDGANTDLSNLTDTGANIANWSTNVSNCITNIPQDIKLELNNGTLTLKAGSKVYVPNGVGSFDELIIQNDLTTITAWGQQVQLGLFVKSDGSTMFIINMEERCSSGSSAPTATNIQMWYDTTNNLVKRYAGGADTGDRYSLPIALVQKGDAVESSNISRIDQVFNGFGYIGSTVFVLPGVKGLIPNGRNPDGSLKSTAVTLTSVQTMTMASWMAGRTNAPLTLFTNKSIGGMDIGNTIWGYVENLRDLQTVKRAYSCWYCAEDNLMHYFNENVVESISARAFIGTFETDSNNKIASLSPKQAFHAVDYSEYIKGDYVIETYTSGSPYYAWYRRYKSGWVEQGGYLPATSGGDNLWTIVFPKPMADTHYTAMISQTDSTSGNATTWNITTIQQQSTTGFKAITGYDWGRYWYVCGMAA